MQKAAIPLIIAGVADLLLSVVIAIFFKTLLIAVVLAAGGVAVTGVGIWKLRSARAAGEERVKYSESGAPIYRHAPRKAPFQLAIGEGHIIETISDHIERHVGKIETVFHEVISDLIDVDVHIVPAAGERDFHVLVTTGMSEAPMTVPEGAEEFRFAELVLCLPASWPLTQESFNDERNYWPIRWLKMLARMPHEYDTWLGVGHTVPNGDPPEPFSPDTKLCCWMLQPPLMFEEEFSVLQYESGNCVNFLALVPLYREEMDFKLNVGSDELIERFDCPIADLQVLNLRRKNFCG
jgi:hypothetical protein